MTFKMLAASTGWKYTEKELVEKIDFVMADSTSHNLGVIEVCAELQTDCAILVSFSCSSYDDASKET